MLDVLILTLANYREVAHRVGIGEEELLIRYYFAEDRGEHIVFTIEVTEWAIPKH